MDEGEWTVIKTIEAFIRGYLFFAVNDNFFLFYHRAKSYKERLRENNEPNIIFTGLHLFKGIVGFYEYRTGLREENTNIVRNQRDKIQTIFAAIFYLIVCALFSISILHYLN